MKPILAFFLLLLSSQLASAEPLTLLSCSQNDQGQLNELRIDQNLQQLRIYVHSEAEHLSHLASLTGTLNDQLSGKVDFMLLRIPYDSCRVMRSSIFHCLGFTSQFEFSSPLGGVASDYQRLDLYFQIPTSGLDPLRAEIYAAGQKNPPLLQLSFRQSECSGNALLSHQFNESIRGFLDGFTP